MGVVTGAFTSSVSIGQVFGPLVFGAVVDLFGIQEAFYLGGGVGLIGTAGAYWFLRQRSDHPGTQTVGMRGD